MITLTVETEGATPRTLSVDRFPCSIGRRKDCGIVLGSYINQNAYI